MKKLLRISYLEHKTNCWVWNKINFLVGPKEPLLATVKRWKPARFWHVKSHDSLSKTILPGPAEEMLDGQHQREDIPTNARAAHKGLMQKRLESLVNHPSCPPNDPISQGTELNTHTFIFSLITMMM